MGGGYISEYDMNESNSGGGKFVGVFNSLSLEEVRLAETLLRSEEVMVTVSGETGTQVFGRVPGLTGGVSLMVPSGQAEHALQLLREAGYLPAADQTDSVYTIGRSARRRSASRQFWLITGLMALLLILLSLLTYL